MVDALEKNVKYFLSLQAGAHNIVVDIDDVREILVADLPVKVPGALPFVAGLFGLRGKMVTAIDASALFGTASTHSKNRPDFVVVAEHERELYGLLVDAVGEVLAVNPQDIESVPNTLDDFVKSISNGVYKQPKNLYTIIAIDKLCNRFA